MQHRWVLQGSVAVTMTLTLVATGSAQLPQPPSVSVPSVSVPSVPVPPVSTPSVTVGPVTAPSVSTPSVATPSASTPSAPSAPSASAPSAASGAASGAVAQGSAGSGPLAGATGARSGAAATTGRGAAADGTQPTSTSGAGAGAGEGTGAGGRAGARAAGAVTHGARQTAQAARREASLRTTVRRYAACLGSLPALERRVVVLRAALGRSQTRPRATVARLTGLQVARVTRVERRGIRHLRTLGRRGGCAVLASAAVDLTDGVSEAPPLGFTVVTRTPHNGVKAEHETGSAGDAAGAGEAPPTAASSAGPLIAGPAARDSGGGGGGFDPILVIIPLLLLGYVGWVVRGELKKT